MFSTNISQQPQVSNGYTTSSQQNTEKAVDAATSTVDQATTTSESILQTLEPEEVRLLAEHFSDMCTIVGLQ